MTGDYLLEYFYTRPYTACCLQAAQPAEQGAEQAAKARRQCRGAKPEQPECDADCAPLIDLDTPELRPASQYASAKELRKVRGQQQ